jgi:hypothetical protein
LLLIVRLPVLSDVYNPDQYKYLVQKYCESGHSSHSATVPADVNVPVTALEFVSRIRSFRSVSSTPYFGKPFLSLVENELQYYTYRYEEIFLWKKINKKIQFYNTCTMYRIQVQCPSMLPLATEGDCMCGITVAKWENISGNNFLFSQLFYPPRMEPNYRYVRYGLILLYQVQFPQI